MPTYTLHVVPERPLPLVVVKRERDAGGEVENPKKRRDYVPSLDEDEERTFASTDAVCDGNAPIPAGDDHKCSVMPHQGLLGAAAAFQTGAPSAAAAAAADPLTVQPPPAAAALPVGALAGGTVTGLNLRRGTASPGPAAGVPTPPRAPGPPPPSPPPPPPAVALPMAHGYSYVRQSNTARRTVAEDEFDVIGEGGNGRAITGHRLQSNDGTSASFDAVLLDSTEDNPNKLKPFRQLHIKRRSVDSYVATSLSTPSCSVCVTYTNQNGESYACRVLIDTPCACQSPKSADNRHGHCKSEQIVLESFLIGPKVTSRRVIGMSNETSKLFAFAAPPCCPRRGLDAGVEDSPDAILKRLRKVWASLGGIQIQFFLVPPSRCSSIPIVLDDDFFRNDDVILVFQKFIQYAPYFGYVADIQRYVQSVELYKSLPLEYLQRRKVREQCIAVYMNEVAVDETDGDFSSRHSVNPSEPAAAELDSNVSEPTKWVKVNDLFSAIINDLSPAGSYLICTGKVRPGEGDEPDNCGEGFFQNTGLATEDRLAAKDLKDMQERLEKYLRSQTDFEFKSYELHGEERWKVKKVEAENVLFDLIGRST
eukprot:CAMPEP_0178570562 /NCGR_PEP_ID=MMETSP0697-20121206/17143_1 /TAXON_ID=265572 /ORGANISM="Extubocellulus spinifer, Strain CCMP396" /LENGTH=592 /DNA_ID=CAMNT_0020205007 /DNA_START=285 /DNA_END=2063 /DNA_ORIENTATION=-